MQQKKDDDQLRANSAGNNNAATDNEIRERLKMFTEADYEAIDERIAELDHEWDLERTLQLNASVLALTGTVLGILVHKRFFALSVLVAGFLAQHAVQGWCPPLPIFKKLGFRTRQEIDKEKFALKALRGDFRRTVNSPNKAWQAVK